jgi:DNA recombination protein RmuC
VEKAVPIVLMFVPNEGSYILAMNYDSSLGSKAYQKGILIINPTNLMVVLRLIFLTWQNTRQEKNYEAIRKAAAGIYEKYTTFAESYVALGRQIETARNTYEKGVGQLREGRGNLSSRLESLLQYGVTTSKSLPTEMTPILGEEEEK